MVAKHPVNFKYLYAHFSAAVSAYDCGKFCAPLNGGEPVCCSVEHAIPVMEKAEFETLRSRSDLWRRFYPKSQADRHALADMPRSCMGAVCKGARFCERDNRALACRSFPFYPYHDSAGTFIGLATYWIFEDRCWIISNLAVIRESFIQEFIAAFDYILERDESERHTFRWQSAQHRRVFSRWKRPIFLIDREGGLLKVPPHGGDIVPASAGELPRHGPYRSPTSYRRALKAHGIKMTPALEADLIPVLR